MDKTFHVKHFTSKTQKLGEIGEEKACMFLLKQGFSIVERNISNKFGEIDIVARKGRKYCFFEVKAGKLGSWFNPAQNLTKAKIRKLIVSVEHYCLTRNISDYLVQGIIVTLDGDNDQIEIIDLS